MKIKELTLKNFKGIKRFTLSPNGEAITSVYGSNASGKTTLADGFSWLLFGKDSLNSANFDIKGLDIAGEAEHGLEHTVSATVEDGSTTTDLKKVYSEKWVKRRGSASKEFTGHAISHWIDGVPVKQKEYTAAINNICDEDVFRLLTNAKYFNEVLHWQERRKLLLLVCGDISDEDVIASDDKLSDLPGILGKRKLDDHKKVIASRRIEINRELDKIPVRIDEVKGSMVDTRDYATISAQVAVFKDERKEASGILKEIRAGGESAVLTTQLREIENKVSALDNTLAAEALKATQNRNQEQSSLSRAVTDAEDTVNAITRKYVQLVSDQKSTREKIKALDEAIARFRKDWHKEDAITFEPEDSDGSCPTCGQSLPKEKIEAAKEKAQGAFNILKADMLRKITREGKAGAEKVSLEKATLADIEKQINSVNKEVEAAQKKSVEAVEALGKFKNEEAPGTPENPERARLTSQLTDTKEQIKNLQAGVDAGSIADAEEAISAVDSRLEGFGKELLQLDANKRIGVRIQELKDQERTLSGEFEELERQLHLCESFIRSKVGMLTEKINAKFGLAKFKLFNEQINEGVSETCVTTLNGITYGSMNSAGRIQVGLDIIKTLQEHFDKRMVIFIDNAESVHDIPSTDSQQIHLIVSEKDQVLRVE